MRRAFMSIQKGSSTYLKGLTLDGFFFFFLVFLFWWVGKTHRGGGRFSPPRV